MKKIPKSVKVILGLVKGLFTTATMVKMFPECMPVLDMLTIVNCAFCVTLLTAGDEKPEFLPVAFLFWLMSLSMVVCPVMAGFTMAGVFKGLCYVASQLAIAYAMMRIRFLLARVKYDSAEAKLTRMLLYDDLYKRFFGKPLLAAVEEEKGGED